MTPRAATVLIRPIAVVVLVMVTFVLANESVRTLEGTMAAGLIHLLGMAPVHRVQVLPPISIAVFPPVAGPFVAVITPSCSALSALLAITALSWFVPRRRPVRRLLALGCALTVVLLGNVLRIVGSVGVGLVYGRSSLVLFHDWVGSLFAFGYTLGGYVLMLALLLPAGRSSSSARARRVPHPFRSASRGAHRVSV